MNTYHKKKSSSLSENQESLSLILKERNTSNIESITLSEKDIENSKNKVIDQEKQLKIILEKINHKSILSMLSLERYVYLKFNNFYSNEEDFYDVKVINDIICNESTHVVATFKDYLINGDTSEFLQKLYTRKESKQFLPKIFEYYDSCSVIFPNYVVLPESKYIYKNIQRKQRVIDNQQDLEDKQEQIKKGIIKINEDYDQVFNTVELDSILDQTDTSGIRNFFGIKNRSESNLESQNISIQNFIKKIATAENNGEEIQNKKSKININCITINSNKGRNYKNLDSGYINDNSNTKKNNNGINSINSKNTKNSSSTIEFESKNQNNIFYANKNNNKTINNSSSKKQNLINNLLVNNSKEKIIKALEEINKNKSINQFYTINSSKEKKISVSKKNLPPTDKVNNKFKHNKISSSTYHIKTLSSSSSSPEQRLITSHHSKNVLSMSKLQSINQKKFNYNKSRDKIKENLIRNFNFRDNIPFTSRESKNFEYMNILNPKVKKVKTFNKKISAQIPISKNNNIKNNKSYNNINKQKEFQTINNEFKNLKQIHKKKKFNFKENTSIPLNSKYITGKVNQEYLSKSPYRSPKKKIKKNYSHFHSNSSLIGNNNDKNKKTKIINSVFPKEDVNFKGLQIKGFKELFQNTHNYNSRNSKGPRSERILFRENTISKTHRNSNFSNITFMEMFSTIYKK